MEGIYGRASCTVPNTSRKHLGRLSGPDISDEVGAAIKRLKNNKSPGPGKVYLELLKLIDDIWTYTLGMPTINFYTLANANKCKDNRIVSLMSHVLKIFLYIIHNYSNS